MALEMFAEAARKKLRFTTPNGQLSAEDLWDLPLTSNKGRLNLDDVARGLHLELKSEVNISFVDATHKPSALQQLRFDLVKFIIDTKLAERADAEQAQAKKARKDLLLSVLAKKQDSELEGKSREEIEAEIAALG